MKFLERDNLNLIGLIGSGESGKVYLVQDQAGAKHAVKVLEGMSINRALIANAYERLESGQWPTGVMRLERIDLDGRPACWQMPFFGEMRPQSPEGEWRIWSLQHRLGSYTEDQTWVLIKELAKALAEMHRKRVAHGNLKPGNVFFDASGNIQLVDWALGNMPGANRYGFTDALLYQPPEQLLDPDGYQQEAGYGWDVFAFGVLSYRLLTGSFPRCDDDFRTVAPKVGEDCMSGLQADLQMIASNLMEMSDVHWPEEASAKPVIGYRSWIEQCLRLNPQDRPGSMIEVMKGLADVDSDYADEIAREALMDQRRQAKRSERKAYAVAFVALTLLGLMIGVWLHVSNKLSSERADRSIEHSKMRSELADAFDAKSQAEDRMNVAIQEKLNAEQEVKRVADAGMQRLKAMREIDERLFEWGMEKGSRTLPALDGREVRLAQLEKFYEDFIREYEAHEELSDEVARAKLHYAEIALVASNESIAQERLETAIKSWEDQEMDAAMKLRLGRDALLLAIIKQRADQETLEQDFQRARKALNDVPAEGVDVDQLRQWQAILDFHEAKWLSEKGDEAMALEQLKRATKTLSQLADSRPDAAVLRSELASCYLSSATILEGLGKLTEAGEVRQAAAEELVEMLKKEPDNVDLMLDLAGCYGAVAESALLSGEIATTSKYSSAAMVMLDRVLKLQPESREANTRKGAQLGIQAGLLRDQGKSTEAMKAFEEGIAILQRQSKYPLRDYRLALLIWQKGRMLGFSGKKVEEIKFLTEANESLKNLNLTSDEESPRQENLHRSRAYLLGDLAHALDMGKQADKSKAIYQEAISVWQALLKLRPNSEEYRSALEWNRQRVNDL